jgi:hypothetical protein
MSALESPRPKDKPPHWMRDMYDLERDADEETQRRLVAKRSADWRAFVDSQVIKPGRTRTWHHDTPEAPKTPQP